MNVRQQTSGPYGPCTVLIRTFLVHFAGLGADAKHGIVQHHTSLIDRADYRAAESILGETIARAGRMDMRDALAGPFLQLVGRSPMMIDETSGATSAPTTDDPLADLEPIAEPALAALMALMVSDILPTAARDILYAPFAAIIPIPDDGASGAPREPGPKDPAANM